MTTTLTTQSELPILIGGSWRVSRADTFGNVYNPSTGEVIARVPLCDAGEVDDAVKAARAAFAGWSQTPAPKRASVMFKYRSLIETNFEELARLVTRENGKTLEEARGDVRRGF